MKTYTIKINGEDLELSFKFALVNKMELKVGKLYELGGLIQDSKLGLTDLVNFYYLLQAGGDKTQDDLMEGILKDGTSEHLKQIVTLLAEVYTGTKAVKSGKKH